MAFLYTWYNRTAREWYYQERVWKTRWWNDSIDFGSSCEQNGRYLAHMSWGSLAISLLQVLHSCNHLSLTLIASFIFSMLTFLKTLLVVSRTLFFFSWQWQVGCLLSIDAWQCALLPMGGSPHVSMKTFLSVLELYFDEVLYKFYSKFHCKFWNSIY